MTVMQSDENANTLFYNFGEHKSGSVDPSSVEMVLVNVVIVSLGPSVASCFFSLAIIKIFQTRKEKFTIKKSKRIQPVQ